MACLRDPLGVWVAIYGEVDKGEGPLLAEKRSLSVIEPALMQLKCTEIDCVSQDKVVLSSRRTPGSPGSSLVSQPVWRHGVPRSRLESPGRQCFCNVNQKLNEPILWMSMFGQDN